MHIYGVGSNGNMGSGVQLLMNKKYNQNKEKMGGRSFEKRVIPATINAEVVDAKLTMDSNRVTNIRRPFITVESEVRDIWGDVKEDIGHVSFLPENRPSLTYIYTLNNEEIKGFIDAGMYHNPRFEEVLGIMLQSEQFEITDEVDIQTIDVINGDEVTPVVLVQDMGIVQQVMDGEDENQYTSFDYAIEHVIDMALQLEAEGISTSALMGEDEVESTQEIEVEIDEVFDAESTLNEKGLDIEQEVLRQIQEMDSEVDVSDAIDISQVFGQTSEQQRIHEMRELTRRGEDWDDLETDGSDNDEVLFDQLEDSMFDSDDSDYDSIFDNFSANDIELTDTMEVELEHDKQDDYDDEPDLDF